MAIYNIFQLFTDPTTDPATDPAADPAVDPAADPRNYSQDDVDKLLADQRSQLEKLFDDKFNRKFAEYKTRAEKDAAEAARKAKLSAQEKAEEERDELQKELDNLRAANTRNELINESRKILAEKNINVSDDILQMLVGSDAEATQKAVDDFSKLFEEEVGKAVKAKLAGNAPKSGGQNKLTKAEIMDIKDPIKRQQLITQNMDLFK